MQIYCFDIDGAPEWPTGTAVTARDRRSASSVILYRDVDLGNASDLGMARRSRALSILASSTSKPQGTRPQVELFTFDKFLGLAAPDAATAAPALQKLREEGFFRVAQAPPPPPPPPPVLCSQCREARPVNAAGLCVACASARNKTKITADPPRRRIWLVIPLLIALVALALYVWWPTPTPTPEPAPAIAPIVQFSANHLRVKRGTHVQLSWNTSGFSSVSISPNIGRVPASGKHWVVVDEQITYSLTGTGAGDIRPVTVTIFVTDPEAVPPAKPSAYSDTQAPPPQTSAPSPVEAPTPAEAPAPARPDLSYQSRLAVTSALENWAAAYRANDPQRQAALYAPQVERFFKQQNVTSAYVQTYMTNFYARGSQFTSFSFTTPTITLTDSDNATVNFVKHYTLHLANGDTRNVDSRSEIHLTRITGVWKINFERDFLG